MACVPDTGNEKNVAKRIKKNAPIIDAVIPTAKTLGSSSQ